MTRLVLLVAVLASVARADIPPPDSSGCRDKAAGAACKRDDGTDSNCVTAKCSRRNYSNGPPGTMVQYDCLKCRPEAEAPVAAAPAPAVTDTPTPAPPKKSSCATVPAETAVGLLSLVFLRRRRSQLQSSATDSATAAGSRAVEPRHR
jgi:hypothetical protein